MATKDTKLEDKDQLVIRGDILADSFRDRQTGKSIAETGESAWEKSLKDKINYDSTGNQVVVNKKVHIEGQDASGVGLVVDEKASFGGEVEIGDPSTTASSVLLGVHGDTQIHGELMIDNLNHLQNPDGEKLIELVTKAEFEGEFVYKTGVVYIVYDTDGTCYVRYYVS